MNRALRRFAVAVMIVCTMAGAATAAGFAWFVTATGAPPPLPERSDGIVALTGGADRIEHALRLLAERREALLLISGVGGAADFKALAARAGADAALAPRVTIGRAAASTRGNAAETADWAHAHQVRSLIVVTSAYHMPRALAELARALPDVALHPAPVHPIGWRDAAQGGNLRLLAGEYAKFLAAEAGLSAFVSRGEERAAARGPTSSERSGG